MKIVTLEEQRLTCGFCQCVRETISKIQPRRVTTSASEIAICCPRDARVFRRDRLDTDPRLSEQIIKTATGNRITTAINHNRRLEIVGRGEATAIRLRNRNRKSSRLRRYGDIHERDALADPGPGPGLLFQPDPLLYAWTFFQIQTTH